MVKVEYIDEDGLKFMVTIPEEYQDQPEIGIFLGPPSLDSLGLPKEYEKRLNNQLFDRKLFSWSDVRRRPEEIKAALSATFKLDVLSIMNLYKEEKDA